MAQGTVTVFNEFKKNMSGLIDLSVTTDFSLILITNAVVPTADSLTPDSSDFTACTTGGGYTGPVPLTTSWSESAGTVTFDSSTDPAWTALAGSPIDIYYAIIYSETAVGKDAVCFVDMTADDGTTPVSLVGGNVSITWNANGIFTI